LHALVAVTISALVLMMRLRFVFLARVAAASAAVAATRRVLDSATSVSYHSVLILVTSQMALALAKVLSLSYL